MDTTAIRDYLYRHIPLSKAMGIHVEHATAQSALLRAPLAPNINHRDTVFGGSASALAILAAWTLLFVRTREAGIEARVVIQRNSMNYELPIPAAFTAEADLGDEEKWERFERAFRRKGVARIQIDALLYCEGTEVGQFSGEFVALSTNAKK